MPEQLTYRNYWDYRTGDATYRGVVLQVNKAVTENADVEVNTEYLPTYYANRTETWVWASMFDGTTIYRNGQVEVVGNEGALGSFSVNAGDVVTASRPVGMMASDKARSVPSDVHRGRKFGVHTNRYQPHNFHVYAIEAATVTYEWVAGVSARANASTVGTQAIAAGSTYTFTSVSEGSHYFTADGDVVISSVPSGGGDGLLLMPAAREGLIWRQGGAYFLNYTGTGSLTFTNATGYTSAVFVQTGAGNSLFSGNSIADGAGGDTDPLVPTNLTAPGYLVPHAVADFVLASIEPCDIIAEYWNGSGWTNYATYGFQTASRATPHAVQVGAVSGADPQLAAGPWRFRSDNGAPFYMRTNDPTTDDEYSPHGYWLSGREQVFVTGNYGAESVEVQADEAFDFSTTAVTDSDTVTVDAHTEYADEVTADAPTMYARLDEFSGPVQDETGNYHGEAVGPVQRGISTRTGRGVYIDGADGAFPRLRWAEATWMPTGPFTAEAWCRTTRSLASCLMGYGGGNEFLLFVQGTTTYVYTGAAVTTHGHANVADGVWHHMVVTFDGTTTTLYLDGVPSTPQTGNNAISVAAGKFFVVGQEQDANDGGYSTAQAWYGDVDEVAVYGTALSASRVAAHYAAGGGFNEILSIFDAADTATTETSEARDFATVAVSDDDTAAVALGGDDATFVAFSSSDTCTVGTDDVYTLLECSFTSVESLQVQEIDRVGLLLGYFGSTDSTDVDLTEARDFATVAVSDDDTAAIGVQDVYTLLYVTFGAVDTTTADTDEARDFATVDVAGADAPSIVVTDTFEHTFVTMGSSDTTVVSESSVATVPTLFFTKTDTAAFEVTATNTTKASLTAQENQLVAVGENTGDEFITLSASDVANTALAEVRDFATVEIADADGADLAVSGEADNSQVFLARDDDAGLEVTDVHITPIPVFLTVADDAALVAEGLVAATFVTLDADELVRVDTATTVTSLGVLQFLVVADTTTADVAGVADLRADFTATDTADLTVTSTFDFATVDVTDSDLAATTVAEAASNEFVFLSSSDTAGVGTSAATTMAVTQFNYAGDGLAVAVVDGEGDAIVPLYASDFHAMVVDEARDFATVDVVGDDTFSVSLTEERDFATVEVVGQDTHPLEIVYTVPPVLVTFAAHDDDLALAVETAFAFAPVTVVDSDLATLTAGGATDPRVLMVGADDVEVTASDVAALIALFGAVDTLDVTSLGTVLDMMSYLTDSDAAAVLVLDTLRERERITDGIVRAGHLTHDRYRTPQGRTGIWVPGAQKAAATAADDAVKAKPTATATPTARAATPTLRAGKSPLSSRAAQAKRAGTAAPAARNSQTPDDEKGTPSGDGPRTS